MEGIDQGRIRKKPWGFGATTAFGIIIWVVFLGVQLAVAIGFVAVETAQDPKTEIENLAGELEFNGLLVSLATLATAVVCSGLILLLIKLRQGPPIRQYLDAFPIARGALIRWLGLTLVFILASDGLTYLLGRPVVPEFLIIAYKTAGFAPLLWVALIFGAPLFEEIFFRGFLFKGFQASRIGSTGAILITSLCWAVIHSQYGIYERGIVFAGGLLLGIARVRTQSLYTPLAMHALFNVVAILEVVTCLRILGNCG